jgi:superfamily I DNA/RNA helicase
MTFPSPEQEKILVATSQHLFVQACPGAGKTRVIAVRFLRHITKPPNSQGIALLSFTNAAADELRDACTDGKLKGEIGYPNFIGTIDSFIAQYLVLPFEASATGERLQLVDSWDNWGFDRVRLTGGKSTWGLSLDSLIYENGEPVIDWKCINHPAAREEVKSNLKAYQARAATRLKGLNKSGYISCSDARQLALKRIRDPKQGKLLGRALAARFVEVLLDEAQDCNDEDLEIMEWLARLDIQTVVVCDPDQAIFEFRTQCSPTRLQEAVRTHERLPLTGNFRSSPAICRLAATLREDRPTPDTPLGPYKDDATPIRILPYRDKPSSDLGKSFLSQLEGCSCVPERSCVLAHKASVAAKSVGAAGSSSESSSTTYQLALAVAAYRAQGATSSERLQALREAGRVILQRLRKKSAVTGKDPEKMAKLLGMPDQWLRLMSNSLLRRLPLPQEHETPATWVTAARELLSAVEEPPDISWKHSAKEVLRNIESHVVPIDSPLGIPHRTIHKAKGQEFEAVMFVIPPDSGTSPSKQLLANWRERNLQKQEPNRVAYVAATRAKRLLVIAIPSALANSLLSILAAEEVPFEKLDAESATWTEAQQLPLWKD